MKFIVVPRDRWHDYSDCDVMLAVRSFAKGERHVTKPATKLFNAWLAGVPAVLGVESAYRVEGKPGKDYLEVLAVEEVREYLQSLSANPSFRDRIIGAGRRAAALVSADAIAKRWLDLLEAELAPRFVDWQRWFPVQVLTLRLAGRVREGLGWRYSLISSVSPP
jgi:hypothetical protein